LESLEELRYRVSIQFAKKSQTLVSNILDEKKRNKFQQTDMQGIDKVVTIKFK
jgi:hypothetical protein